MKSAEKLQDIDREAGNDKSNIAMHICYVSININID
jgi:hypothetical protein